jgi:curli biogenesis system outer membrane secretion channel CsgG
MKSIHMLLTSLAITGLTACTSAAVTSSGGSDMESARADAYDGPKARIAIADFEDKMSSSGYYRGEYGRGMSDMLGTALFQTNRYIVLEREKLRAIEAERKRRGSKIKIEDADIMVTAAVTGFDPGTAGAKGSLGGAFGGMLSGITGAFQQAHVAIDLRVVDVDTGRVIAATSVEGKASGFGGGVGGIGGKLGGGLSGFAKGPMETAIRQVIQAAVDEVVKKTPKTYYRYK